MNQLSLDMPPRSHRNDPESSRAAERRSSKTWGPKHRALMWVVGTYPGLVASGIATRVMIGEMTGALRASWPSESHARLCEVRKRLSDLAKATPPKLRRHHTRGDRESRWFVAT